MGDMNTPDMSDPTITALWGESAKITPDLSEQAWLVAMCVSSGRNVEWLKERRMTLRGEAGPPEELQLTREQMGI